MRKFWVATSILLGILLAAVLGIWGGVIFHESILAAFGVSSPRRDQGVTALPADNNGPQVKAAGDQPNPTSKPLYHCGMHPWIIQDHPGTCPISPHGTHTHARRL